MKNNAEIGMESQEIKKKEDFDAFYKLRSECNKGKYLELLNERIMLMSPKNDKVLKQQQKELMNESKAIQEMIFAIES